MNELKPIETTYNGHLFRSRLEARFALYFDTMGIRWEYESEGYETPYGLYLPDFWLPDVYMRSKLVKGILFEVKPDNFTYKHDALEYVANGLRVGGMLARGFNPNEDLVGDWGGFVEIAPDWDSPMYLLKCDKCGFTRFDYPEYEFDDCDKCGAHIPGVETTLSARHTALAYRFW